MIKNNLNRREFFRSWVVSSQTFNSRAALTSDIRAETYRPLIGRTLRSCPAPLFTCALPSSHHELRRANNCRIGERDGAMESNNEMQSFAARYNTFTIPHQLSKRRASAQSKKKGAAGNTVEWPHERPTPEDVSVIMTISNRA